MPIRGGVAATLPFVFACSLDAARAPECPAVAAAPSAAQGLTTTSVQPSSLLGKIADLPLENGEIIQDCQVEYRTLGAANADKSHVVVWATWFSGITKDLVGLVGPGKLVDSSHYQVVLVGALANGASSSPSNTRSSPTTSCSAGQPRREPAESSLCRRRHDNLAPPRFDANDRVRQLRHDVARRLESVCGFARRRGPRHQAARGRRVDEALK